MTDMTTIDTKPTETTVDLIIIGTTMTVEKTGEMAMVRPHIDMNILALAPDSMMITKEDIMAEISKIKTDR